MVIARKSRWYTDSEKWEGKWLVQQQGSRAYKVLCLKSIMICSAYLSLGIIIIMSDNFGRLNQPITRPVGSPLSTIGASTCPKSRLRRSLVKRTHRGEGLMCSGDRNTCYVLQVRTPTSTLLTLTAGCRYHEVKQLKNTSSWRVSYSLAERSRVKCSHFHTLTQTFTFLRSKV